MPPKSTTLLDTLFILGRFRDELHTLVNLASGNTVSIFLKAFI
jgi:hypothetical protein